MRTISLAGFGLLLAALGAATMATRVAGAAELSVELSNGLLSLHAADVARLRGAALADPDPRERARALEDLAANLDQRAALDAVVEVLGRESNPGLLERALDIVGSERAVPLEPVLRLAASNPEPRVRIKALTRLSEQAARDVRARQALEVAAADDSSPAVRD